LNEIAAGLLQAACHPAHSGCAAGPRTPMTEYNQRDTAVVRNIGHPDGDQSPPGLASLNCKKKLADNIIPLGFIVISFVTADAKKILH
jgi:hypothetical protein